jgi:hypothetical protein
VKGAEQTKEKKMKKLILILASFTIMGCGPYLKMAPGMDVSKSHDTLLTTAIIDGSPTDDHGAESPSIIGAAISLANNIDLAPFGEKMIKQITKYLAEHRFIVKTDAERAKKIDPIKVSEKLKDFATVAGGFWVSPETSYYPLPNNRWLLDFQRKDLAEKLDTEAPNEAFLFIQAEIRDRSSWVVMSKPEITLHIRILNEQGHDIFQSKSYGYGTSAFWWSDRSPTNLGKAIDAALAQLGVIEKTEL